MNTKKLLRWSGTVLLMVFVLTLFHFGFAQDDDSSGVEGAADAADNLNVSAVPTQEQAQSAVDTPPNSDTQAYFDNVGTGGAEINNDLAIASPSRKVMHPPIRQAHEVIYESTNDKGEVLSVYGDYSVVVSDSEGEYFHGYVTVDAAERLMIVGTGINGNQYAIYADSGYRIGLTADGDVLLGTNDFWYLYDYDEDGNFLGMSDSEGNEYDVAADEDGNYTITDADGNTGEFYADGSYGVYDADGNLFDEGGLFGEYDGDDADEEAEEGSWDENTDEETSGEAGETESSDETMDESGGG